MISAREDRLLALVLRFFEQRIFGPLRLERQERQLRAQARSERANGKLAGTRLRQQIAEIDRKIKAQVIAPLAHNLARWVGQLGLRDATWRAARTIRRWLIALPGRLTRTARRFTLHLPARWPWQAAFAEALSRIRALPAVA